MYIFGCVIVRIVFRVFFRFFALKGVRFLFFIGFLGFWRLELLEFCFEGVEYFFFFVNVEYLRDN